MVPFEYIAPDSLQNCVKALGAKSGQAAVLAGGTDLLSLMKERIEKPTRVVSLRNVDEVRGIAKGSGGLRIGAAARVEDLLDNEQVASDYPSLKQAAEGITSPQVRAMGTVGGDLLQRPRCWYFRNGFGLLAMHDGKSLVPGGENRYHAILGNKGPAYFVSASSFAPALIALGAQAKLMGPDGERTIPVEELYRIPSGGDERETTLQPNEILAEILVPAEAKTNATYEVRQHTLLDWPLTTASVALKMSGDTVEEAVVVMGHVAPKPWRSSEAENALKGKRLSEAVAAEAAKAAVSAATPLSQNKYKVQLAKVAVERALLRAAGKEAA